jgi:hypothetical protein
VSQTVTLWQNYDSPDLVTTDVMKDWLDTLHAFQEKVSKKKWQELGGTRIWELGERCVEEGALDKGEGGHFGFKEEVEFGE